MESNNSGLPDLIGAIDQGTSSTRFSVIDSKSGLPITFHQEESVRYAPKEGWCEMDPMWILESVGRCIEAAIEKLPDKEVTMKRIKCIGLTNQMLTIIMWDCCSGKPLYNAIVWMDVRTHNEYEEALKRVPNQDKDYFRAKTGIPFAAIFWYTKVPWMIKNVPGVKSAIDDGRCLIGSVDSWLLWNLTGGVNGGIFATDITNASCTGLLNINELQWDKDVCDFFDIPVNLLADIRSTSELYGEMKNGSLSGLPITGVIGDQMSATVGHLCFEAGQSKCTYGTSGCVNVNIGTKPVYSTHGMMTLPLFQFGPKAPTYYNIMGPIQGCGDAIRWIRDSLGLIKEAKDMEELASSVDSNHDCFFVPAFNGLLCPYWEDDARGTIIGITAYTSKAHICRAALESICFQIVAILHAAAIDSGFPLPTLSVDGGMVDNNFMMQIQADLLGEDVVRADYKETTTLGAALMAGAAHGVDIFNVWKDRHGIDVSFPRHIDVFKPKMKEEERKRLIKRWNKAVERSKHWLSD